MNWFHQISVYGLQDFSLLSRISKCKKINGLKTLLVAINGTCFWNFEFLLFGFTFLLCCVRRQSIISHWSPLRTLYLHPSLKPSMEHKRGHWISSPFQPPFQSSSRNVNIIVLLQPESAHADAGFHYAITMEILSQQIIEALISIDGIISKSVGYMWTES